MKLLWIGKRPHDGGGDEIYDRKLRASINPDWAVDSYYPTAASNAEVLWNVVQAVPHPRFKWYTQRQAQELKKISKEYDAAVISLESFDCFASALECPSIIIQHNVTSDLLREILPESLPSYMAANIARRAERRLSGLIQAQIFCLSLRDRKILQTVLPTTEIRVVPPGPPTSCDLTPNGSFEPNLILSGSYQWWPKERDARRFISDLLDSEWQPLVFLDTPLPSDFPYIPGLRKLDANGFHNSIQVGVIADRFLGGFKLKALYYIANNCVCVSFCDISGEFDGLPFSDLFVRSVRDTSGLRTVMDELSDIPSSELREKFLLFKHACLLRFSWEKSAGEIEVAVVGLVEKWQILNRR